MVKFKFKLNNYPFLSCKSFESDLTHLGPIVYDLEWATVAVWYLDGHGVEYMDDAGRPLACLRVGYIDGCCAW